MANIRYIWHVFLCIFSHKHCIAGKSFQIAINSVPTYQILSQSRLIPHTIEITIPGLLFDHWPNPRRFTQLQADIQNFHDLTQVCLPNRKLVSETWCSKFISCYSEFVSCFCLFLKKIFFIQSISFFFFVLHYFFKEAIKIWIRNTSI